MISRLIGKPPYITKSYSRTCRRQNSPNLTSEIYSFAFLIKKMQPRIEKEQNTATGL